MINERLEYMRDNYEIIGGIKYMAPAPNPGHNRTLFYLGRIIENYMEDNNIGGYVFTDNIDLYLPDGSMFQPDLTVIKTENENLIDWYAPISVVPDMVVEVLSKSTKHRDLTVKKDTYESVGVKEYWIVDPYMKCIDVYLLQEGKFIFGGEYQHYTEKEFVFLNVEEKAAVKNEVPVSILPGLKINLAQIFKWSL